MRHEHYLKANKGVESPSSVIWFDTETVPTPNDNNGVDHSLSFGWAIYRRRRANNVWTKPEYFRFTSLDQFWTWVEEHTREKTCLYLYCHNTNFDLPVLNVFKCLPEMGWTLKRAIIDAPPTILDFRKGNAKIRILDTLNYFRMSLDDLGKMIGVPKMAFPSPTASPEYWDEYGKQDVVVIMEACLHWWAFLAEHDFGNCGPTLASQAMNTYRHRFMTHKVLTHGNEECLRLERAAYHGGRCEAFRIGKFHGHFTLLDVTSMFPAMMERFNFPARLAFYMDNPPAPVIRQYLPTHPCVALCDLETDEPIYAVVHNDKLVFPTGRFVAPLAGPEVNRALACGHLRQIIKAAFYQPDPIFTAFVRDLWRMRREATASGNHVLAGFLKIMLNSLYGKFGQRGMVWEEEAWIDDLSSRTWIERDVETGEMAHLRQLGGLVQRRSDREESRDSCPAIAAYVTSYARLHLWDLIQTAGRTNVYYCDTDSLLVNDQGLQNLNHLIQPNTLGLLKVEGEYQDIEINGPKDYTFGIKWKLKGARASSIWFNRNTLEQDQWTGLKGQLREDKLDKAETRRVVKRLRRVYDKGTVDAAGFVSPLVLDASSPD